MNNRLCFVLAAVALAAGSAPARAVTDPAQPRADAAARTIEIVAARPVDAAAMDAALRDIDRRYEMSDGRRLSVVADVGVDSLVVRHGRGIERRLQRESAGRYVSRDGRFLLSFDLDARGEPAVAHLTMPAPLP